MAYKIRFKKSVIKDLKILDLKDKKRILDKTEEVLSENPQKCPLLRGRFAGLRKLRIGSYRVIFSIMDKEVWVLRIKHRRNVYR